MEGGEIHEWKRLLYASKSRASSFRFIDRRTQYTRFAFVCLPETKKIYIRISPRIYTRPQNPTETHCPVCPFCFRRAVINRQIERVAKSTLFCFFQRNRSFGVSVGPSNAVLKPLILFSARDRTNPRVDHGCVTTAVISTQHVDHCF